VWEKIDSAFFESKKSDKMLKMNRLFIRLSLTNAESTFFLSLKFLQILQKACFIIPVGPLSLHEIRPGIMQKNTETLIAALQSGDTTALESLYSEHREAFFRWAGRRLYANRQDMEDAWQDAVVALYVQVQEGRLAQLRCGVRTWLFAVGYRRLLNNNRKVKRLIWRDHIDDALADPAHAFVIGDTSHTQRVQQLEEAMLTLSPQCRELLVQRYFWERDVAEIQQIWAFGTLNATSASISRCLRRLKKVIGETLPAISSVGKK
jgi:RNA polymerase sigma factor (sigma-70 family)